MLKAKAVGTMNAPDTRGGKNSRLNKYASAPAEANNPAVKILTAFANGELTYGDAVALMKKQRQLMRAKLPPQP